MVGDVTTQQRELFRVGLPVTTRVLLSSATFPPFLVGVDFFSIIFFKNDGDLSFLSLALVMPMSEILPGREGTDFRGDTLAVGLGDNLELSVTFILMSFLF